MFAYPGGASMPLHQAARKYSSQIRTVLPRHEQGGGFAARRGEPVERQDRSVHGDQRPRSDEPRHRGWPTPNSTASRSSRSRDRFLNR
ncbi:MAG: hypothetical protein R3B90_21950 [Planctomycetaceae bacterium]